MRILCYCVIEGVNVRGFFIWFRAFLFPVWILGIWDGRLVSSRVFFSSRRLCRSCLAKIAFNRLCQLVSERSVGHPTTSFFLFFFLSFPRDRAARRNLSWCLFFFSFFLVQIFTTSIKSLRKIFRCLNNAKFKIESDIIWMILYLWLDFTRLHADILYLFLSQNIIELSLS